MREGKQTHTIVSVYSLTDFVCLITFNNTMVIILHTFS